MAYLFWDPAREMLPFNLPILGRPILWYGFFFALGFFGGYYIFLHLLKKNPKFTKDAKVIAEKTIFYVLVGTIVGARLGDLLFYQGLSEVMRDPLHVFKVWEGGLASHGGALGILTATLLLARKLRISFLHLLDLIVIPTGFVAACIRVGNFFNQEILGKPTTLPWAVVFGHPADGSEPLPRHPVQLYEAFFYLILFITTWFVWKQVPAMRREGRMVGVFLILVFIFRFFIEFLKEEQSALVSGSYLTMGQWLSIPFVLLGIYLLLRKNSKRKIS